MGLQNSYRSRAGEHAGQEGLEPALGQYGLKVHEALPGLGGYVALSHQVALCVLRNHTGREHEIALFDARMPILYPGNVWLMFTNGEGFQTAGSAIDHLGWRALDLIPKMNEMRSKGATVTRGPNDLTFENGTIHIYFIDGPRDVTIEIVQRARNMR